MSKQMTEEDDIRINIKRQRLDSCTSPPPLSSPTSEEHLEQQFKSDEIKESQHRLKSSNNTVGSRKQILICTKVALLFGFNGAGYHGMQM